MSEETDTTLEGIAKQAILCWEACYHYKGRDGNCKTPETLAGFLEEAKQKEYPVLAETVDEWHNHKTQEDWVEELILAGQDLRDEVYTLADLLRWAQADILALRARVTELGVDPDEVIKAVREK